MAWLFVCLVAPSHALWRPALHRPGRAMTASMSDTPKLSKLRQLEADLAAAVSEERYSIAAALRDEISTLQMDGEMAVLAVRATRGSNRTLGSEPNQIVRLLPHTGQRRFLPLLLHA